MSTEQYGIAPPDPLALCSALLAAHALRNGGLLPGIMPPAPRGGVAWWLVHQESRGKFEKARQLPVPGKDAQRWEDGYSLRVVQNLRVFLGLTDEKRAYIVSAVHVGIHWRGDEIEMFERIVEETERMNEMGVMAYRKEAVARAKRAIRGMQP